MDVTFDPAPFVIVGLASVACGALAPIASIAAFLVRGMRRRMTLAGTGAALSLVTLLILMAEPSRSMRLEFFKGLQALNVLVALAAAVRAALI